MKKTVCVLFGGTNSEHEVSLRSATSVLENIDTQLFEPVMVGITKSGRWLRYRGDVSDIISGEWENGDTTTAILSPDRSHNGLLEISGDSITFSPVDVVFPVLHGKCGEDGTLQGLLEISGLKYVGCDVLSSALCMDKAVSHQLLVEAGIPKTDLVALTRSDTKNFDALEQRLADEIGYPMFVKPANAGSSVGVSKVKSSGGLRDALSLAFNHDRKIVIERTMHGREIECSVMGNDTPEAATALGEIAPTNEFYDYDGKYLEDTTDIYIPARIDDETTQKVREIAVKAYKTLGCSGLSRVDFFVTDEGEITLNEINTLPGFTSISMYPKLFIHSGLSYTALITKLIQLAL